MPSITILWLLKLLFSSSSVSLIHLIKISDFVVVVVAVEILCFIVNSKNIEATNKSDHWKIGLLFDKKWCHSINKTLFDCLFVFALMAHVIIVMMKKSFGFIECCHTLHLHHI